VWTGGAIYIRADGSIEPASAPITTRDRVTYTLTDDVTTEGIVIERDNIILDGNGRKVTGQGKGYGILLENRKKVTVRNIKIEKFDAGIVLWNSSGITVTGNTITDNRIGIVLWGSSGNRITGNVFWGCGLLVYDSYSNVVEGNIVNGRPLVYLENARDVVVRDAGQVIIVKSVRVRVENLNLSNTTVGVELWNSSECTIINNTISNNIGGILLWNSSGITVTGNTISNNSHDGIYLGRSSGITITGNTISNNKWAGIVLWGSSGNRITGNTISNKNNYGIFLDNSSGNTIAENKILNNNWDGIYLGRSSGITITGNTISNNKWAGINLQDSSGNRVFLNNFIGNGIQVYSMDSVNSWDDGSRGNFWSDYKGSDVNNDGIGDTPYTIDEKNVDRYPLIHPYEVFPVKVTSLYGTTSGEGRYEKGSKVIISVSPVLLDHGNGTRHVFSGWYDEKGNFLSGDPEFSLTAEKPLTVTAKWDTEYRVEASSVYGSVGGSGWYKRGFKAAVSVSPALLDYGNGTRHVFSGWYDEGGNLLSTDPEFSLTVVKPFTVTARWDTEYKVEVYSPYGSVGGSGWYEKGTVATVLVSPATVDAGFFMEYVFEGWVVEGWLVSASPVYSFTVDRPVTLTARWVGRVKLANVFALVVFAMLAVGLLWRSRVSTRVRGETRVVVEGVASEEVETRVAGGLERLKGLEEELEKVKMYLSKLEEEWKKGTISTDAYEILKKEYQDKIEQLQNEIKKIRDYEN